jgi:hypothetical protein
LNISFSPGWSPKDEIALPLILIKQIFIVMSCNPH